MRGWATGLGQVGVSGRRLTFPPLAAQVPSSTCLKPDSAPALEASDAQPRA
jgi:hypothetical protein